MAISPRTADNRWHIAETTVAVLAAVTAGYLADRGAPFPLVLALGILVGALGVIAVLSVQALVRPGVYREQAEPSRRRRATSGMASSDGSGIARRDEEILREIVRDR